MQVIQSQQNLLDDLGCLNFLDFPFLWIHIVMKVAIRQKLHNHVECMIIFEELKNLHDVWMICLHKYK